MTPQNRYHVFCASILAIVFVVPSARAELQNVIMNGFYSLPVADRFVRTLHLPQDEFGRSLEAEPSERRLNLEPFERRSYFYGEFSRVTVPAVPSPKNYPYDGRVALSFYFGVPDWSDGTPRYGDLIVEIDGYQVFSAPLTKSDWQPRVIDLGPWAGQVVSVVFRGAWMDGDPLPVVVALPRIVAWHGPYYQGMGGLNLVGRHGGRAVPDLPDSPPEPRPKARVDGTAIPSERMIIERFYVYRLSKLRLESTAYEYTATLREGNYWLPLPLAADDAPLGAVWEIEGEVEAGAVDIIPNFMADDEKDLRAIEAGLALGSDESQ